MVDICKIDSIDWGHQRKTLAKFGEAPGGPVVRAQCFLCRSVGSASGILQARWFGQKKILRVGWAVSGIVQASLQKEDTPAQTEVGNKGPGDPTEGQMESDDCHPSCSQETSCLFCISFPSLDPHEVSGGKAFRSASFPCAGFRGFLFFATK